MVLGGRTQTGRGRGGGAFGCYGDVFLSEAGKQVPRSSLYHSLNTLICLQHFIISGIKKYFLKGKLRALVYE